VLLFMPRVFAHAHYAHYDMPVSCLWVLAQVAFVNSLQSRRWIWVFGAVLGLAAATKFTGWFAAMAPIVWVVLFETLPAARRWWCGERVAAHDTSAQLPGTKAIVYGLCVAALVLVAIQPPWWADPVRGFAVFLESNLTRAETKPLPALYFGTVYEFSLPWHNTLVISAVTVPVLVLLLGGAGIAGVLAKSRREPEPVIWLLSWLVLMIVRAMPAAPGHDMERQFLPSFLSFALLAGLGVAWLKSRVVAAHYRWVLLMLPVCALLECAVGITRLYPYTLSYYNSAFGGLKGAERHGFELTYYWDTMEPEFLQWVRERSAHEPMELRFPSDLINIEFLREWGRLPRGVPVVGIENTRQPYYVLQRRRGLYYPYDSWIDRNGSPSFVVSRQGVDLLRVYSYEESFRAYQATQHEPIPSYLK
jgi:hypothetical protein